MQASIVSTTQNSNPLKKGVIFKSTWKENGCIRKLRLGK